MRRSDSGRRQQLPGRVALIALRAGRPRGRPASTLVSAAIAALLLGCASDALAHGPTTAIGRAVEAFGRVSVSYEPGSAVSDVEAGNFTTFVNSNPNIAFMPAEAATELAGGPDAIAEEIAREAALDGTLVVLVGTRLGTWSKDVDDERLAELEREARVAGGGSPAATVEALVRSVQAEPASGSTPWALLGVAILVLAASAFVLFHRLGRRSPAAA